MKNLFRNVSAVGIVAGFGLLASAAVAQTVTGPNSGTQSTSSNSDNASYSVPITSSLNTSKDSHNNNSTNYDVPISDAGNTANSDNSDSSTHKDSHNNNSTNYNVPISDSGNTANSDNSDSSTHKDSHNDNSVNTTTAYYTPNTTTDAGNSYTSSTSSITVGNVTLAVGYDDLTGSVSGQSFSTGGGGALSTGAIDFQGNALQGFAGINNATYNSGMGSLGQAVNSVTATSAVTFQ